jgi:hypothetical protein
MGIFQKNIFEKCPVASLHLPVLLKMERRKLI